MKTTKEAEYLFYRCSENGAMIDPFPVPALSDEGAILLSERYAIDRQIPFAVVYRKEGRTSTNIVHLHNGNRVSFIEFGDALFGDKG